MPRKEPKSLPTLPISAAGERSRSEGKSDEAGRGHPIAAVHSTRAKLRARFQNHSTIALRQTEPNDKTKQMQCSRRFINELPSSFINALISVPGVSFFGASPDSQRSSRISVTVGPILLSVTLTLLLAATTSATSPSSNPSHSCALEMKHTG